MKHEGASGAVTSVFSHVCLSVEDLQRSTRFYQECFGFKTHESYRFHDSPGNLMELEGTVDFSSQFLVLDGVRLELMCFHSPGSVSMGSREPMYRRGFTHLAIRVGNLDAVCERVTSLGGEVLQATRTRFPMDSYECDMVYCTDPDGVRIELLWMPSDINMQS